MARDVAGLDELVDDPMGRAWPCPRTRCMSRSRIWARARCSIARACGSSGRSRLDMGRGGYSLRYVRIDMSFETCRLRKPAGQDLHGGKWPYATVKGGAGTPRAARRAVPAPAVPSSSRGRASAWCAATTSTARVLDGTGTPLNLTNHVAIDEAPSFSPTAPKARVLEHPHLRPPRRYVRDLVTGVETQLTNTPPPNRTRAPA